MKDVAISDPDVEDLGPAMLALEPKQRRFVVGWIGARGKNATRVARAAGYSDAGGGARVRAHFLLRNPKVLAALREEAERHLDGLGALAVAALGLNLGSNDPKVRQVAVDSVLDRTGFARRTTHKVEIEQVDSRSTAELLAEVKRLMGGNAVPVLEGKARVTSK